MRFRSLRTSRSLCLRQSLREVVSVDPPQFDVGEHRAGGDDPVGPDSEHLLVAAAAGERSAVPAICGFPSMPRRFHLEPPPSLGQRSGHGMDPAVVFFCQAEKGLHGDRPVFRRELRPSRRFSGTVPLDPPNWLLNEERPNCSSRRLATPSGRGRSCGGSSPALPHGLHAFAGS